MSFVITTETKQLLSWLTAAWILRLSHEPLRVVTLQPGDGQYDALALVRSKAYPAILMNRSGGSALVEGRVIDDIWGVASGQSGTGPRELALLLLSESEIAADLAEIPDSYGLAITQIATAMNFYREVHKKSRRVECREVPIDVLQSQAEASIPSNLARAALGYPDLIPGQSDGSWIWRIQIDGTVIAYCDTYANTLEYVAPRTLQPAPHYTDQYGIPAPPIAAALVNNRTGKTDAIEPLAFALEMTRHWGDEWDGFIEPLFEVPDGWEWSFPEDRLSDEELREYLD